MRRFIATFFVSASVLVLSAQNVAYAAGALTNGATHTGTIQPGGLDTWAFTAAKNDGIAISIGTVFGEGFEPFFRPWIRLTGPDGASLGDRFGNVSAQIEIRAPSTGTYTVRVSARDDGQNDSVNYILTLAKTPGPYTISAGDEGGPVANGPHSAVITTGDLDAWTFQATANNSVTISIGVIAGTGTPAFFRPWIRLKGPDGAPLGDQFGNTSAQIEIRAPLTGTYTVLVSARDDGQSTPADYTLTLSGASSIFSVAGILAVVGSTQGNGAFFRTGVQIYNPSASSISGKFVFHTQGVSGSANDPALAYTLAAGQTIDYADLLPAMGIPGGLGSLDIVTNGNPVPIIAARVFSDAGQNGSAGFFIEPLAPDAALQVGDSGVIIAPSDPAKARLNIGIRSLETGTSFQITVRNKSGVPRGTLTKTYSANFFEQVPANTYLGLTLEGSDNITFSVNTGKVIIYGSQTDNKTQDPSVLFAKRTF